jgi:hypothetical protein
LLKRLMAFQAALPAREHAGAELADEAQTT